MLKLISQWSVVGCLLGLLCISLSGCGGGAASLPPSPTLGTFIYQVRVEDQMGNPIEQANVAIEISGVPTFNSRTDAKGYALFPIPIALRDQVGRVIIVATAYKRFELNVKLYQEQPPEPVRLEPASASATAASLSPPSSTSTQPLETPNAAVSTVAPTEVSGDTLDDDFNSGQLDTMKWQPPGHPEFISVEDNALHIRVTEQQTADGAQAQLKPIPTGRSIQEISFTITTASWAGKKEGGVGIRLYMTDDIDHLVNAVHLNGLGIDIANCKQAPCKGNYPEYNHDETPIQIGRPAQVRIVWNKEKGQIGFYINGVLHAVASAKETPIKEFSFGMYATSGDAFDVTIDNVHVVYTQ